MSEFTRCDCCSGEYSKEREHPWQKFSYTVPLVNQSVNSKVVACLDICIKCAVPQDKAELVPDLMLGVLNQLNGRGKK